MPEPRLAVCSWSLRPSSIDELIERLAAVGIDRVQLALSPLVRDPATWKEAPDRLRDAGITIVSGMMAMRAENYATLESIALTGGIRPPAVWIENYRHAVDVAHLAAARGIGLVTFHAGFLPEEPGNPEREVMLRRLRTVADIFARCGVALALETGQETAETLGVVLDELDRPAVGVNFDPANMILYGKGDPVRALGHLAPRVLQIHVKDALPTDEPGTWGREVPVGTGAVNWPAFFAEAAACPHDPEFVIEREAGADRTDDIRTAADVVRRHAGAPTEA